MEKPASSKSRGKSEKGSPLSEAQKLHGQMHQALSEIECRIMRAQVCFDFALLRGANGLGEADLLRLLISKRDSIKEDLEAIRIRVTNLEKRALYAARNQIQDEDQASFRINSE